MPGACAVDQCFHAALVQLQHQLLDREDDGRRAADVIEHRDPRPLGHMRQHGVDDLLGRLDRDCDLRHDDPCAALLGDEAGDIVAGVIAVVRDEHLVAGES